MSVADIVGAFANEDVAVVENAIPWLALSAGVNIATAPVPLQKIMLAFSDKIGLKAGMDSAAVDAAVSAHYEANPLPASVQARLQDIARTLAADVDGGGRAAAAKLLGETAAKMPVGAQPAPEGAMKNSPLARFNMTVPPKKG